MTRRVSVRNLSVGQYIKKGYSSDDDLLVTDQFVETNEDLERLKEIGLSYCLIDEKAEPATEKAEPSEERSFKPEDVIDQELERLPTLLDKTRRVYREATDELEGLFRSVHGESASMNDLIGDLDPYLYHLMDFMDESPSSVSLLTQIEQYDEETINHSLNVAILSLVYGDYRGFDELELRELGFGALVHDIGKTRLSRKVVEKERGLEDREREMVENHPARGRQILDKHGAGEIPRAIAYEHHERPDGSGYPEGKTEINQFSRIVSVFDMYEALTAPRPYRDPVNPLAAYRTLQDTFSEFPETRRILRGMIQAIGFFPVGCLVRLNNDDLAVVFRNHPENLKQPVVKIIKRGDERTLEKPYTVDLDHVKEQKELINDRMYDDTVRITDVYGLAQAPELQNKVAELFLDEGFDTSQAEK